MSRLSKNFELWEFEKSETAALHNLNNKVPAYLIKNVAYVAQKLQIIRDYVGTPVVVTSGFRSFWVNKLVGGVHNSHHLSGLAVDFYAQGYSSARLTMIVQGLKPRLGYIELVRYPGESRIHLAFPPPRA